jgi:hypothetical protein
MADVFVNGWTANGNANCTAMELMRPSESVRMIHRTVERQLLIPLKRACPTWLCTEDGQNMCLSGLAGHNIPIALVIYPPFRWTGAPEEHRQRMTQCRESRSKLCQSRGIFLLEIYALQNLREPVLSGYVAARIETAADECHRICDKLREAGDAELLASFEWAAQILDSAVRERGPKVEDHARKSLAYR